MQRINSHQTISKIHNNSIQSDHNSEYNSALSKQG